MGAPDAVASRQDTTQLAVFPAGGGGCHGAGLFVVVVFPARVPVTNYAVIGVQQSFSGLHTGRGYTVTLKLGGAHACVFGMQLST